MANCFLWDIYICEVGFVNKVTKWIVKIWIVGVYLKDALPVGRAWSKPVSKASDQSYLEGHTYFLSKLDVLFPFLKHILSWAVVTWTANCSLLCILLQWLTLVFSLHRMGESAALWIWTVLKTTEVFQMDSSQDKDRQNAHPAWGGRGTDLVS